MRTRLKFVVLIASALAFVGVANADGVAWADLSEDQRGSAGRTRGQTWDQMDDARQEQIATGAARWLEMNQRQQGQAQDRFQQWQNLGDDQRG